MSADPLADARAVIEAERCRRTGSFEDWCAVHDAVLFSDGTCAYASDLLDTATQLLAVVEAVEHLFAGGPDTPCHTVWRDEVECVAVPLSDLRAALTRWRTER